MGLSDYLAKNYLTASKPASSDPSDSRPHKKRKKNRSEATGTLLIADDDADLSLSSRGLTNGNEDENDTPTLYESQVRSAEFRKSKKNVWKTLETMEDPADAAQKRQQDVEEEDEADTLLRSQMNSTAQSRLETEAEDAPAIVSTPSSPKMSSGVRPGLQTAADTARLLALEEATATTKSKSKSKSSRKKEQEAEPETIYRDATGRRIDLSLRRAEIRAAETAKLAAEKQARDDAMGEVQLQQRNQRKEDLENAKYLTLGRSVDDEELNDSLREVVRWDDPMAAYLASNRKDEVSTTATSTKKGRGGETGKMVVRKKEYTGSAAPNRYGIKPGWRWDGVDRGNGFERDWFQSRGRKARVERAEYQWQMDE